MWTQNLIFSVFLFALAAPQLVSAQSIPTKAAPSESASGPSTDPMSPKPGPAAPAILSFIEWKSQRVQEAQLKLEQMNKGNNAQVWQEGKSSTDTKPNEQKLNFNVDVALQLNIQDYFSMYLKNLSQDDLKEATKKLSPDEVADLLIAYKNSMDKPAKLPLKFPKTAKDNAKSKNTEL